MATRHTVILGGSSGIGLATARLLLDAGGRVTITGRDEARLAAAGRALGPAATTVRMDAAATDRLADGFAAIGPFDHLVLALGSGRGVGPFNAVDVEDVARGFAEKVFPHFAAAQAALRRIAPDGSMVFVSSIAADAAAPGTAGIGAANAAIAALVPILAVELRPLRVNGVAPGVIDTPWWDAMPADDRRATFADFAAKTPVGRVGRADEVAAAIAALIDNAFINGHVLVCDGGLRLTI